jgi:uncharacterized protein DUF4082/PKD domain-containing protein
VALAWNGSDPTQVADTEDYELGVAYRTNGDITISHVRVWSGAGEEDITNRRARIWSSVGSQLAVVTLPDNLTPGWTLHALDTPLEVTSSTTIVVSYMTGGNYGSLSGALDNDVPSADGLVTALSAANAPGGSNGRFNETPGSFPATGVGSHPFYGPDFQYTSGIGGNTAPRITALTSVESGATATVTAVVADDETLTGLTVRFKWGDDTSDTVVTYPTVSAQHTYTASGNYAVLVTATDASGAADNEAVVAEIHVPDSGINDHTESEFKDLFSKLTSHAKSLGIFDRVDSREPVNKPIGGMACALWLNDYKPVPAGSGLAATTMVLDLRATVYCPLGKRPATEVEAGVLYAVHRLMKALSGDFALGDLVRNIDLLGQTGDTMHADFGYLQYEDTWYRIGEITLPLIINDVYEQVS